MSLDLSNELATWQPQAACGALTGDEIDNGPFAPSLAEMEAFARTYCAACPVRIECGAAGLDETEGVWGGTTPRDRHGPALWRKRSQQESAARARQRRAWELTLELAERGLTVEEIANRIGYSEKQVRRILQGEVQGARSVS